MTKHLAAQIILCVFAGWLIAIALLYVAVELTDGKAFDSTWLSS